MLQSRNEEKEKEFISGREVCWDQNINTYILIMKIENYVYVQQILLGLEWTS